MGVKRIQVLDGWRFVSVTMVIISHLVGESSVKFILPSGYENVGGLGTLGVNIFFFISGFVICTGLLREQTESGEFSVAAFYIRRFFRIVPALYLYLAFVTCLGAVGFVEQNFEYSVHAALFTCNFLPCDWNVGHTWSLAVEEQFYLTFPLALGFFLRLRPVSIALAFVAGLFVVIIAYYFKFPDVAVQFLSFCHILLGIYCALDYRRLEEFIRSISPWWIDLAVVPLVAISVLPPSKAATLAIVLIQSPLIAFVLLGTIIHRAFITRLLTIGAICTIGQISYGIYLWQELAFSHSDQYYRAVLLVPLIAIAATSYYVMERPLMRLGGKLSRRIQLK
jgi:peptidoglycan/LPS O-acetylase OafA/YrhL